ncbi:MAG TPA: PadR family transcriptional regulator [Thermoanaerobaculia bacterium]
MDRELKRGTLEMVLLHLFSSRSMYGYEVANELRERTNGHFELKEGTLYPVLYRLEEAGQVSTEWITPERGVPRKYYVITDAGRADLERQLGQWRAFTSVVARLVDGEGTDQGADR